MMKILSQQHGYLRLQIMENITLLIMMGLFFLCLDKKKASTIDHGKINSKPLEKDAVESMKG